MGGLFTVGIHHTNKLITCGEIFNILRPCLQIIFIFLQMHFIFLNQKINIFRRQFLSRVGLTQLGVTNICLLLRALIIETLDSVSSSRQPRSSDNLTNTALEESGWVIYRVSLIIITLSWYSSTSQLIDLSIQNSLLYSIWSDSIKILLDKILLFGTPCTIWLIFAQYSQSQLLQKQLNSLVWWSGATGGGDCMWWHSDVQFISTHKSISLPLHVPVQCPLHRGPHHHVEARVLQSRDQRHEWSWPQSQLLSSSDDQLQWISRWSILRSLHRGHHNW